MLRTAEEVLLVSADSGLAAELRRIFEALGRSLQWKPDVDTGLDALGCFGASGSPLESCHADPKVVLLDARLPGVGSGRLLAAVQECGIHERSAVALIAEGVSDEWIARLREGVIDDIVPRNAELATWRTHLNTIQRGYSLSRELKQLREIALLDVDRDVETGALNRDAMLQVLFRETDRVQRLHGALSLVVCEVEVAEIDSLSPAGSEAISWGRLMREVADRTAGLLRSYDVLGRAAERRLLIVLPGCSTVNAEILADRMRMEVFGEVFRPSDGKEIRLSGHLAVTASRGRSAVVVLREAEAMLNDRHSDGDDREQTLYPDRKPASPARVG